jgi:hypothetical protein
VTQGIKQARAPRHPGLRDSVLEEAGFELSVPRDTTKVSRGSHFGAACFPANGKAGREREPTPTKTPGVFRGTDGSNPASSNGESLQTLGPSREISPVRIWWTSSAMRRGGADPRTVVTTTPRPAKLIRDLVRDRICVVTRGSS